MSSRLLVLCFGALLVGCGRKSDVSIKADPSAKGVPSVAPARNEAVAIYALVLRDHFARKGPATIRVFETLSALSYRPAEKFSSSLPTARADTIEAFRRLPRDQLFAPFAPALGLDLIPFADAVRLFVAAPAPGAAVPIGWPEMGIVRFTPIAFDATQSDALVGFEHWSTPRSRLALIIHLVRRDGTWFEQEILRCP